jgi:hypothetical protein
MARTSSPTMTPVFRERTSWTPIFVVARITAEKVSALVKLLVLPGLDRVLCFSIRNWELVERKRGACEWTDLLSLYLR